MLETYYRPIITWDGHMITRLATLLLCVTLGQSASARTAILCTAQEQWTFAEEIGRPANWVFNVEFEVQGQQISVFRVGGLDCRSLSEVYVNDEAIWFNCGIGALDGNETIEFAAKISRLSGDFLILRTYYGSEHLDGVTIGYCESGSRRF